MKQTIIYVNFSPYTNAGNILDYLLSTYDTVICFTFHFYSLGKNQEKPNVSMYTHGKLKRVKPLFQLPVPKTFLFLLLPLRSVTIFIQIILTLFYFKNSFTGRVDYFSVNGFTAWCGVIAKSMGLVSNSIYWVWDYYPPIHHNPFVAIMRNLYTVFDALAIKYSSSVIYLNERIAQTRSVHQLKSQLNDQKVVPIGTQLIQAQKKHKKINNKINLVFFGVIKPSQGLTVVFDYLQSQQPNTITLHVIGNGPEKEIMTRYAMDIAQEIIFHGYIAKEADIDQIISNCDIGIAPYIMSKDSVTPYTDPSKLKRYIGCTIPVITTPITTFAKEIESFHAGIVISPHKKDIENAVKKIMQRYEFYEKGAQLLSKRYQYTSIYPSLFSDIKDDSHDHTSSHT